MPRLRGSSALLAWLAVLGVSPARAAAPPDLDACEARIARAPDGEAAACLVDLARARGAPRKEAARRLEQLFEDRPEDPWFGIHLGSVRWTGRRPEEAEALYRESAGLAARRGLARPEVFARLRLARLVADLGRPAEAEAEIERAARAAGRSGDRSLQAKVDIARASHLSMQGELEAAYDALRQARDAAEADPDLLREYLYPLSLITQQTGRYPEALKAFQRLIALGEETRDAAVLVSARSGLALTLLDELRAAPTPAGREKVLGLAREALAMARAAERPDVEFYPLWILGSLGEDQEAREHLERCLEIESTPLLGRSYCKASLARHLAAVDPAAARRAVGESLELAERSEDVHSRTYARHAQMLVSWAISPAEEALKDALAGLDAIEALREKQKVSAAQAGLFSTWAEDYYWLSGSLLEKGDLDRAFGVVERMRSRTLIDALRLARPDPSGRPPDFASLERVRRNLGPDEALLSFQIAPSHDLTGGFAGGSWLLVSTRAATRAYRLADRADLRAGESSFTGMFAARDGGEAQTAAVLYERLLAAALADLPQDVRRLVIVPDDALHRLPFAALRPAPDAEPLAARYEISLVPSATLWLGWRERRGAVADAVPLVFADPDSPEPSRKPLPYARDEGRSVLRHFGEGELRLGAEASEAWLKSGRLGGFGLLHFATHARAVDINPDNSYVALAPGPGEDGRLHVREIVQLALPGRTVVLSSCESAKGEILRGEGVMGLARAFFQAGARTVVASLWPLRDDDGAALFDRFYRHLADGRTVAAALHAAQRDRIADGAPAEAWAGVVLLGDGEPVPLPGGRKRPEAWPWVLVVTAVLLAAAIAGTRRYRSRRSAR